MKKALILTLTILVILPLWLEARDWGEEYPRAKTMFSHGQRLIGEGDYSAAIDTFQELVNGFKNSEFRDIYNYSLARAYYLSKNLDKANEILATFPNLFPNSDLISYAYHLRANCEYRLRHLESAFGLYSLAYRRADNRRLRNLAEKSLLSQVEAGYYPPDSVLSLAPGELQCALKSRMAVLAADFFSDSQIDSLLGNCPRQVKPVVPKTDGDRDTQILIGILLPFSGSYAPYGQAVLDGIMLAAESKAFNDIDFDVMVYDTRADQVTAGRQALALAENGAAAVIGPLVSPVAATAAAVLSAYKIPLLVPAATQAGFTDLSPYSFQLSPSMTTIGRGMAQYAVQSRGMTTMAVISPTSIDEMTLADAFVDEAQKLGAGFLGVERFRPGETDFGPYIQDIKEAILGPYDESIPYVTLSGDTLKPGEAPVAFDGIFIPATSDQLYLILPQLDFYRMNCSYLGTSEWDNDRVLKLGDKVLRDAVFYSSGGAMRNSARYDGFASDFDTRFGRQPDRLAAVGFDAVNLLIEAYRSGQKTPDQIVSFLKRSEGHIGASGDFLFGEQRSNLALPLFFVEGELVKPLGSRPQKVKEAEFPPDSIGTEYIKYEW